MLVASAAALSADQQHVARHLDAAYQASACSAQVAEWDPRTLGSFRHREEGQLEREMTALDDTLLEKVERLVDVSRQPLRWTSSTTVVIAQLVERIEALEAALREIADAVSAPGVTDADYAAAELRSSDRLSESIS